MPSPQRRPDGDSIEVKSNGYGGLVTNADRNQTFGLFHHHNGTIGDGNKVQAINIDWTTAIPSSMTIILADLAGSTHTCKIQATRDATTNNWTLVLSDAS